MNNNKKDILDNIKLKGTGFTNPESYFADFESNFEENNSKINSGFEIPSNYFNKIEDKIISKTKRSLSSNKTGFKTPNNYFESIEAKILAKTNSAKVIPLKNYKVIKRLGIAVAASLILFFSLYNFSRNSNNLSLDTVKADEIENWMDNDLITFNTYEISEIFTDADLDLANNVNDEVLDYFEYIDIENLILEN